METGYEAFSFYYDQLTENVEYPQRAAYFHKLIQKYRQSEGVVLLDLACGTGSLSEEFAKLGYDVLGVDYSYGMLNQAMQKKLEHNLPIQYICQDMRELDSTPCTSSRSAGRLLGRSIRSKAYPAAQWQWARRIGRKTAEPGRKDCHRGPVCRTPVRIDRRCWRRARADRRLVRPGHKSSRSEQADRMPAVRKRAAPAVRAAPGPVRHTAVRD